ncbi:MAG TPA: PRC-barrel domain-containing protein [Euzebyales bacterium]|nr:PRC-barrel domain-containing protein [Euzebyales bacterium]
MTLRFSRAEHTPVYSKSSADEVGRVLRYVVDPRARRVVAVHVAGRRRKALLLDWAHVVGFGPDAVVMDDDEHLRAPAGEYEEGIAAGRMELRGRRVLTDAGFDIGPLTDVEFDEATGAIERIETARAHVRGSGLRAIGPWAVVVAHAAVDAPEDVERP